MISPSIAFSYEPRGTYRTRPNTYGGNNYYSKSGQFLGRSQPNVFGGKNYSTSSGKLYSQTNSKGTRLK
jgi:hypothetical protein